MLFTSLHSLLRNALKAQILTCGNIRVIYRQGGEDQKGACASAHCHAWVAGTGVRAGVPTPCHAINGVAVVNGATGYQIWRWGLTCPAPSRRRLSEYKLGWRDISAPLVLQIRDPAPGADLVSTPATQQGGLSETNKRDLSEDGYGILTDFHQTLPF